MRERRFSAEGGLNRALIVKTSSLGDIIHSFPVVSYLAHKFPECPIDWLVEEPFAELVESHPLIDRAIKVNTKHWRRSPLSKQTFREFRTFRSSLRENDYDLIVDLQGNIKSGLLSRAAKGKIRLGFGLKTAAERPNILFTNRRLNPPPGFNIRDDYLNLVKRYFNDDEPFADSGIVLNSAASPQNFIKPDRPNYLVCPGSRWINKQLPAKTLAEFLVKIQESTGCHLLFSWGSEQEKELAQNAAPAGSAIIPRLSLPELQNLMAQVDLVIAMDSLPLHLAGTTNTPTYSLFGPSSAQKYRPIGARHRSFQGPCPYNVSFEKRCPKLRSCQTGACIREVTAGKIFADFKSFTF